MLVDGEIYRANKDTIVKDVDGKVVALGDFAGLTEGDEVEVKDNVVTVKKSATAEVAKVDRLIGAINADSPEADKVAAARKAYDALNTVAKDLVEEEKVTALENAEAKLNETVDKELVDAEAEKLKEKTFDDVEAIKAAVPAGIEVSVKIIEAPTVDNEGKAKVTLTKNSQKAEVGGVKLAKLPRPILEAPKGETVAENLTGVTETGAKFLVAGLVNNSNQQIPSTLDEVKKFIDEEYGVNFNANAIKVTDGKIEITGSILSTEDWNKVKANGDKKIPYRITLVQDDTTAGNPDNTNKVIKIAMYEDGVAILEEI